MVSPSRSCSTHDLGSKSRVRWIGAFSLSCGLGKSRTFKRFSGVNEVPVAETMWPTYSIQPPRDPVWFFCGWQQLSCRKGDPTLGVCYRDTLAQIFRGWAHRWCRSRIFRRSSRPCSAYCAESKGQLLLVPWQSDSIGADHQPLGRSFGGAGSRGV